MNSPPTRPEFSASDRKSCGGCAKLEFSTSQTQLPIRAPRGIDHEGPVEDLRFRDGFSLSAISLNLLNPFIIETSVHVAVNLDRSVGEPIPE